MLGTGPLLLLAVAVPGSLVGCQAAVVYSPSAWVVYLVAALLQLVSSNRM